MWPYGTLRALIVAIALIIPLGVVVKRGHEKGTKLTWATSILMAAWLTAIAVVLIGDVPSRILYWFDQVHAPLSEKFPILEPVFENQNFGGNPGYQVVADIVANTVQGIFFVAITAAAYFWGERHRKEGKFKS
jgi:hypothetical protein